MTTELMFVSSQRTRVTSAANYRRWLHDAHAQTSIVYCPEGQRTCANYFPLYVTTICKYEKGVRQCPRSKFVSCTPSGSNKTTAYPTARYQHLRGQTTPNVVSAVSLTHLLAINAAYTKDPISVRSKVAISPRHQPPRYYPHVCERFFPFSAEIVRRDPSRPSSLAARPR